jgi:hypothetical protein
MEINAPVAAPAQRPETNWSSTATRLRASLAGTSADARWTAAAVVAFLGVTVWWLTQNTQMTDFDSAKHTRFSFLVYNEIAKGSIFKPFTEFDTYPPLGHLVGALGVALGGHSNAAVILALNAVFVPVLAGSCYAIGRQIGGSRAGLLAALFALGVPMIVSQAHEAYLDPLQAAMVALSVFAILRSQRFEHVGVSALAGVATGLALLTKETTPIFLAGLIAVVLLRGGWRNWRGLGSFCLAAAVIGGSWYLDHLGQLHRVASAANTVAPNQVGVVTPEHHFAFENLSWYFWDASNVQLRAPLLLLLLAGVVAAIRSSIRDRGAHNIYPELLAGALVSYVGVTLITLKDPRYSLPALVYMAVLATAWIPGLRPRLRPWLIAGLAAAVAASFASVDFGLGGRGYQLRLALPGAHPEKAPGQRYIAIYSTLGWLRGPPETKDGNVLALMRGLRRAGVRRVGSCCSKERSDAGAVDGGAERVDLSTTGLAMMAVEAKLKYIEDEAELTPKDVFLALHAPVAGAPPCQRLADGTGIYAVLGNPAGRPFSRYTFICPGRTPTVYGYGASSAQLPRAASR